MRQVRLRRRRPVATGELPDVHVEHVEATPAAEIMLRRIRNGSERRVTPPGVHRCPLPGLDPVDSLGLVMRRRHDQHGASRVPGNVVGDAAFEKLSSSRQPA